jgi:hypothetical protein
MIVKNEPTVFFFLKKGSILMILIMFLSAIPLSGQQSNEEIPPLKDRLFYGGNFALQLGTYTNIEVSPVIGLWLLPRLAIAAGPSYRFYKFGNEKTDIYGGRTYLQFVVLKDLDKFIPLGIHTSIFLHCEDEFLSLQSDFWENTSVNTKRFIINTILAGGGISQQIGQRSSINFIVIWALNDSGYNIYSNPEIRIGFVF